MRREAEADCLAILRERWARYSNFDLETEYWQWQLQAHSPGVLLEAIKIMRSAKDPRPERRVQFFERVLEGMSVRSLRQ